MSEGTGSSTTAVGRTPAVTVVIPCFNHGRFVGEAVDSVLAQTRLDAEILVVDDGSDDAETRAILGNLSRPHTRVIRSAHGGLAAARNRGIAEARGRYLCALDADDRLAPAFLERTLDLLDGRADLTFASCWLETFGDESWKWTPERCDLPALLAECTVCTAALVRRDAVVDVGGYDENMPAQGYEDWDLWISLVAAGHQGTILPEVLFHYRRASGSMSMTSNVGDTHLALTSYLIEKHRSSYELHLQQVMLLKEEAAGRLLDSNRRLERGITVDLERPLTVARDTLTVLRHQHSRVAAAEPAVRGQVRWGDFARETPFSPYWGADRGRCIDRHYIESFLADHAEHIAGHVMEVHDDDYTRRFGGDRVLHSDVLDIDPANPRATIVADLRDAPTIPDETFDCVILTQTLQYIDDMRAAVTECRRILRPNGTLLATLPCLSRIAPEQGLDGDFWRVTVEGARDLFAAAFSAGRVDVRSHGSVLTAVAYLYGLACEEIDARELTAHDPEIPLVVTVCAQRVATR